MPVGCFISPGRVLDRSLARVKRADELGFDAAYTTHIAGRDSLSVLMAFAAHSERIRLGTGVLPIFSRTPVATAQQAATIDEFSGGRMVLGLGVSHQVTVENWFGAKIDKPVTQMRHYVAAVRAMFRGEDPPESSIFPTRFRFMGYEPRAELPIYLAALSPNMLKLAAQVGDGVMLWLCSPTYIREVVMPEITAAREEASLSMDGFEIVAAVPVGLTDDVEAGRAAQRQELVTYMSLPFYRAMLERSGFEAEIAAFDEGIAVGDVETAKSGISDAMLDEVAGIGDAGTVAAAVERYADAGVTSPCIGGIPRTDFDGSLEAVAEKLL